MSEMPRTTDTSNQRFHRLNILWASVIDMVIMLVGYSLAFWGRTATSSITGFVESTPYIVLSIVIMLLSLFKFGVYHHIWKRTSGHDVTVIINAVLTASVLIFAISLTFPRRPLPLSVVVVGNILSLVGFVAVRYRSRLYHGLTWRWRAVWHHEFPNARTQVLIVGAGNSGQAMAWRMKHRSPTEDSYGVVGFVDDDPYMQGLFIEGCPVLGTRTEIPRLVEDHNIDLIVVSIHNISGHDFRDVLSICEMTTARIKVVPDLFALMNARKNVMWLRDVQPEDLIGRSPISRHQSIDMTDVSYKRVLVTGAAGSIGSELCRQIIEYDPVELILLDSNESGLHDLYTEVSGKLPVDKLKRALVDITDKAGLSDLFEMVQPEIVFHAAAYKHVPVLEQYPDQALRVNVGGTFNLVDLAVEHEVERFVLISTDKAVNPSSVMGASKRMCELLLGAAARRPNSSTLFTSVRFGNVLGSRGSVVPTFNRQIENGGPVTITHADMTRYFMSIPEAVNLVIHAACMTSGADIFLLNMGEVVRIVDLAERMIRLRGLRPYEDISIVFTGMRPGEKLHEELYTDAEKADSTDHPNIIQLLNPYHNLDETLFMTQVRQLLDEGLQSEKALEDLCKIIRCEPYKMQHVG